MERRLLLAIVLMLGVVLLANVVWPVRSAPRRAGAGDTTAVVQAAPGPAPTAQVPAPAAPAAPAARGPVNAAAAAAPAETVWVTTPLARFGVSTRGGELVSVRLLDYASFAVGDSSPHADLVRSDAPFLVQRLAVGADTLRLDALDFAPSARALTVRGDSAVLTLTARRAGAVVTLRYTFQPDNYLFGVSGSVGGIGPTGGTLVLGLSDGVRQVEADTADDYRHYAVVTKAAKTETQSFASIKTGETKVLDGPFEWAGVKAKYFLVAALAIGANQPPFGGVIATGGPRAGKIATRTAVSLTLPVPPAGEFAYQVYAGPMDYRRLNAVGHDLADANPYGWIFRPIIRPVAEWTVSLLLWMRGVVGVSYGWGVIVISVLIRLLLWPLNQRAMESTMRMQAVAPLLKDVQTRHKNDPEKLQRETLRLYREHGVNPLGGCLPMLLPMPVLFAFYFVFANTIAFRGVPFLWLPDLSRADPYYIIPVVMGVTMFLVSKIGQMGVPPNPQAKTMVYIMPAMMTFIFLRLSAGLNLYYAASNVVSLPQQWIIAKRRLARQGAAPRT